MLRLISLACCAGLALPLAAHAAEPVAPAAPASPCSRSATRMAVLGMDLDEMRCQLALYPQELAALLAENTAANAKIRLLAADLASAEERAAAAEKRAAKAEAKLKGEAPSAMK